MEHDNGKSVFTGTLMEKDRRIRLYVLEGILLVFSACFTVLCVQTGEWAAIAAGAALILICLLILCLGAWTGARYEVTEQGVSLTPASPLGAGWRRRFAWDEITEVSVRKMDFRKFAAGAMTRDIISPQESFLILQRGKLTIPLDKRSSILAWRREKNAALLPWSEELEAYAREKAPSDE
ncbi:MAG: hypothetical protein II458_08965 [Oscillospiraceae bacterium]|nr:hypothetical protein [Oscillospiraceae bacterium]